MGFPEIEGCVKNIEGRFTSWVPGMRATEIADWYMICWHRGDIRRYLEAGGDPKKMIIHFLTFDGGVINPLWGKESFLERVRKMKELSVEYVIAPDFSSWANYPAAVKIHNYYRSCVVTCDLIQAGFKVIPNICWSIPYLFELSIGMWGDDISLALLDANHGTKNTWSRQNNLAAFDYANKVNPNIKWILYSGAKLFLRELLIILKNDPKHIICPARKSMLDRMMKNKLKNSKECE